MHSPLAVTPFLPSSFLPSSFLPSSFLPSCFSYFFLTLFLLAIHLFFFLIAEAFKAGQSQQKCRRYPHECAVLLQSRHFYPHLFYPHFYPHVLAIFSSLSFYLQFTSFFLIAEAFKAGQSQQKCRRYPHECTVLSQSRHFYPHLHSGPVERGQPQGNHQQNTPRRSGRKVEYYYLFFIFFKGLYF